MALDAGSLILANYTARIKDTGEVIDTTIEEEAKKVGFYDPTKRYEPRLIAVGEGWVLKGLDEAILSADVGQKLSVEVAPEKGFGVREPNRVKMIPLRKFGEKASELKVGDEMEVENKIGIIRFVGSGRAQVDFNHRYAGKTLVYDLEILKSLQTDLEKISALIRRRLPVEENKLKVMIEDASTKIELPGEFYLSEGLHIVKKAIANDVFKFIKIVNKVFFIETYEGAKPKEPEAAPALPTPQPAAEAITQEGVPTPAPQPIPEAPPQLTPEPSTEEAASA